MTIYRLTYSFPNLEPVCCSMSSSNCCFLTYIQISQEADQVVWYSHLFQNFPQFIVIHTVKGFSVHNEAEVDVFLEFPCFLYDPPNVGNLVSGSSALPPPFSSFSFNWRLITLQYCGGFAIHSHGSAMGIHVFPILTLLCLLSPFCTSGISLCHILLKSSLKYFEHNLTSIQNGCNCTAVWISFGIAFLWDWNENSPFPVLWPLLSFPNLLAYWVQHFHSIIF